ncbi:MAG: hypothetical protein ACK53Y_04505 [bacterium]
MGGDVATADQKKVPKTLDNTQEQEETIVLWNDEEAYRLKMPMMNLHLTLMNYA